jgi:uncharacterized membrane protein YkgB
MITSTSQPANLMARCVALEESALAWVGERMPLFTRFSMGIVYLWFGVLKFFPGVSAPEALAGRTLQILSCGVVAPSVGLPLLAGWECLIGVALIANLQPRRVAWMMVLHLLGTFTPLILFPGLSFAGFGVPTLIGQYIAKNVVLMVAALTILLKARD